MPRFRQLSSGCLRALAVFFALLLGSLTQANAAQVPAAVTAKLGSGGASLGKLWQADGLRLPVIVEFAPSVTLGKASSSRPNDDTALTASIHAVQDAILLRLLGADAKSALTANSPQSVRRMDFSPLFAMSASAAEVERLAVDPAVVRIHADTLSYPQLVQTVPLTGMPTAYASGATGGGQVIAVLDSGVRGSHEFLAGKVAAAACFSNADPSAGIVSACPGGVASSTDISSADDCDPAITLGCGHGTHLAGIAAGFNTNVQAGEPQNGMARAAKLFPINVMSRALPGSPACAEGCLVSFASSQILGLEAVYARRAKLSITSIALGLAERDTDAAACGLDSRASIIGRLRAAGIATVVAAGNDGSDTQVAGPACIPAAIAVAASTKADQRAFFSNWGPQVDLVAPGADILSSAVAGNSRTGYAALSGTSMAVPHVAGAIAALRSIMPDASVDQIEDALQRTGAPISSAGITKPRIRVDQALVAVARPMAPPANDNFANRIPIPVAGGSFNGNNLDATFETGEPTHAGRSGSIRSIWYSYTPTTSGGVTISTAGTEIDTILAVYTGNTVSTLGEVVSNDDIETDVNFQSRVQFHAVAGTQYQIAITGFDATQMGAISFSVTPAPRPANDDFADRITISDQGTVTGSNLSATAEPNEPIHFLPGSPAVNSVWWEYTATVAGTLTIQTFGSNFDTVLAVYTGTAVNALTEVASNDDTLGPQSQVSFLAVQGATYAIAVQGFNAEKVGDIRLTVATPASNDNFANRVALTAPVTVSGNNILATAESGEPTHAGASSPTRSVWWSFTPTASGPYSLDTTGSNFDTVLAVYTGSAVNGLTQVAANNDIGGGNVQSRLTFNATAGIPYAIAVAGAGNTGGAITLALAAVVPPNDNFANRITISGTGTVANGTTFNATTETGEPNHYPQDNSRKSVWYRFTPSVSGTYAFRVTGNFDVAVAAYTGTAVGGLTAVGDRLEDFDLLALRATAGVSYAIAVAGIFGEPGDFSLTLTTGPANDDFANRVVIAGAGTVTGTNVNSSSEPGEPAHNGAFPIRSVWWRFTPATSGQVTLETTGSNFDTVLAVYTGSSFATFASVAANNDIGGGNLQSRVTFQATAGTQYQIAVAGYSGTVGTISLTLIGPRPPNDNFANRITIASFGTVTGTNVNATSEAGEPDHDGLVTHTSVWWRFTPTVTGPLTVSTAGSAFDTVLAVYTGSPVNALSSVASNDDDNGSSQSRVTFQATAGTSYAIAVTGINDATGAISLSVNGAPPANDNFANRITIAGFGTVTGTNVNATAEAGEPNHAGSPNTRTSVWWRFTPTLTGPLTIRTTGSDFDTVLAVYTGAAVNALALVTFNDDDDSSTQSQVTFQATAGTSYAIAVAGIPDTTGAISLSVNGAPPANDNFANRVAIAAPGTVTGRNVYATTEAGEPVHLGVGDRSVWWRFTPATSGTYSLDTIGSSFDTVLAVYTGSSYATFVNITVDDDSGGNLQARLAFQATAGTQYQIVVAGKTGAQGAVNLTLRGPPANDNFANRITIAAPGTVNGTNVNASAETGEPNHVTNTARNTVWWRFTPSASGVIGIDTIGSGIDTVLAVYTGSAVNALTAVASNNDIAAGNLASRVFFDVTAGTSYAIAVAGRNSAQGAVRLTVANMPQPANDNFANRITIAAPGSVTGSNVAATLEPGEPPHSDGSGTRSSVWWRYTPSASGYLKIDINGSPFNRLLAVYTGTAVNALTLVASRFDNPGRLAHVVVPVTAGVSYSIAVAGSGSGNAVGPITLTLANVVPPANDNFANRTAIAGLGSVNGTTVNATAEAGEPVQFSSLFRSSVWWRYTPSANAVIRISTAGSGGSPVLAVYTGGAVNALTLVGRDRTDAGAHVTFRATAGVSYAIAVATRVEEENTVTLNLTAVTPPANDNFANRITIAGLGTVTGTTLNATTEAGEPAHAPGEDAPNSVWWRYTPSANAVIRIEANALVAVYTGTAVNALTLAGTNIAVASSRATLRVTAGVSYAIAVSGGGGREGAVQLTLAAVTPPPNDNFANRITIPGPGSVTGTTVNATLEVGEPSHHPFLSASNSVWWRYTPSVNGTISIDTVGSSNLFAGQVLAVYTGNAVNGLTLVARTLENFGTFPPLDSRVTLRVTAGVSYAIAVTGSYDQGEFPVQVNLAAATPPANDQFASRITIAAPGSVTGTTVNATLETGEPVHIPGTSLSNTVWWRFTPSTSTTLSFHTTGSEGDTALAVYAGTAVNALTPVASNNNPGFGPANVTFNAVAGTSYAIAVSGVEGFQGAVTLNLAVVAPTNDNFADRITIAGPGTVTGNNVLSTTEPGEAVHAGVGDRSVWWRFTPATTGQYTLDTTGSSFNTVLAVYTGSSFATFAVVAFNDDIGGGNVRSRVTFQANAGTQYQIVVAGNTGAQGAVNLTLAFVPPPANDNFANRITIAGLGTVAGTTAAATAEPGEPNHYLGDTSRLSVWYRFTPSVSGTYAFRVTASFDIILAGYTGSAVNALTPAGELREDNDLLVLRAMAGTSYAIAVAGFQGGQGAFSLNLAAGPANDAFANRIAIAAPGTVTGNNVNATAETGEANHTGAAAPVRSVWWRFTPMVTGPLTVQTVGSNFDTVLAVYTGSSFANFANVTFNDDIGGGNVQSRVTFQATAGTQYQIVVAGKNGAMGTINLALAGVPPANDNFANRVTIAAFGSVSGNNAYATAETGEPNHAGNATARTSIWWRFTPSVTGPLQVQTVGSSFNTVLGVYTGTTVNALTQIASNNDIGGGNLQSRVTFNVVAGTSYAIAVAGVSNASGNITLAVNNVLPANDSFANRITIAAPGTVAGANFFATAETNEPFHAGVAAARSSVWWRYTPAVTGPVLVDTLGSNFATVLAVYTGSAVNALTPVASNNDAHGGTNRSKLSFNGVAGTSYAIAVSGETAALTGTISLRIGGGIATPLPIIVSAVTPVARAALVNSTVTTFATVINAGPGVATSCFIAKPVGAPSVSFTYRTITGGQLGTPNTPVNIPAGAAQAFVMALSSSAALQSNLSLVFDCTNTRPASSTAGLNTFLLTATNAPAPADLVSAAVTPSGDGILNVPVNGTGFASLAAQNIGTAATLQARLSASAIGAPPATLPLTMVMCRTNPSTGACLVPPTGTTVNFNLGVNQVATFAAFLTYTGTQIPFDPANKRVFVHFFQGTVPVGSASVAVRTTAPDAAGATAIGGKQAMAQ